MFDAWIGKHGWYIDNKLILVRIQENMFGIETVGYD